MFIGPLPKVLRDVKDDGRSNQKIIAALKRRNVVIFGKDVFLSDPQPVPPPGTVYHFMGVPSETLPKGARSTADRIFAAVTKQDPTLRKPPLRAALFLQERMDRENLYADTIVINEPVLDTEGNPVLVVLGREDEDGVSWVGAFNANKKPVEVDAVLVFLAGAA